MPIIFIDRVQQKITKELNAEEVNQVMSPRAQWSSMNGAVIKREKKKDLEKVKSMLCGE